MNFVKKLIGKVQDYKNNEVVYAEDYNKDFNLLREVINNNAEGVAEAFVELLGLSDSVKKAIEGVITINSVDGSAIVDHTIVYEKLAESTLRKLPNKNELTDLNDNLIKSYYYNETLPSKYLNNGFIRRYTEAEQNIATPATVGFTLNKDSFIDVPAEVFQYIDTPPQYGHSTLLTPAYSGEKGYVLVYQYPKNKTQHSSDTTITGVTKLQYITKAFENAEIGTAVKTLALTNNPVEDAYSYGRKMIYATNVALTFVITYADNTTKTVTVSPGTTTNVTVATNGNTPKQIKKIVATTTEQVLISAVDEDRERHYSYPTITLNYDVTKLDKITENQIINNPSDKVYVHIIASALPKTVSLIVKGTTTVLTKQRTETSVITGYNEYLYQIDCSEEKSNAQNFNIKIEMASTNAKVHGYYIAG